MKRRFISTDRLRVKSELNFFSSRACKYKVVITTKGDGYIWLFFKWPSKKPSSRSPRVYKRQNDCRVSARAYVKNYSGSIDWIDQIKGTSETINVNPKTIPDQCM